MTQRSESPGAPGASMDIYGNMHCPDKLPESGPPETSVEIDSQDSPVPFEEDDSTPPVAALEVPHVDLPTTPAPDSADTEESVIPRRGQGVPFTPLEIQLAMNLRAQGCSLKDIGKRLGRSGEGVRRVLEEWASTADLAKHTLRKGANVLAERVVNDANVAEALDTLDRLDVLPKREKNTDQRVQVVLGLNIDEINQPKIGMITNIGEEPTS